MAKYTIRPIPLCRGPKDLSLYTYRMNMGSTCNSVCYVWYIEGSQPRILVDAGATASMFEERGMPETDLTSVEDGLGRLGLKPEDIQIVIVTHLHWDHVALSHLFKKAKFIVQKKELCYARNPHPVDAAAFDRGMFDNLNLEVVEGEREIIPGVTVFLTPGHTPGGQSVEVDTSGGKAIITGYCHFLSTFEQTEAMKHIGWEVIPPTIHLDVREAYDSVRNVMCRADVVIALHDPGFAEKETIP